MEEMVTITKSEYDELLIYKEMMELKAGTKIRMGVDYKKYKELKDFYDFCQRRYSVVFAEMEKEYKGCQKAENGI